MPCHLLVEVARVEANLGILIWIQGLRTPQGSRHLGMWNGWVWRSLTKDVAVRNSHGSGVAQWVGRLEGKQGGVSPEVPTSLSEFEILFYWSMTVPHTVVSSGWNWETWVHQSCSFCFLKIHCLSIHWNLFWTWESALILFLQNRPMECPQGSLESEHCLELFCYLSCHLGQIWWYRYAIAALRSGSG